MERTLRECSTDQNRTQIFVGNLADRPASRVDVRRRLDDNGKAAKTQLEVKTYSGIKARENMRGRTVVSLGDYNPRINTKYTKKSWDE